MDLLEGLTEKSIAYQAVNPAQEFGDAAQLHHI